MFKMKIKQLLLLGYTKFWPAERKYGQKTTGKQSNILCACLEYRFFVSCKFQANSSYSGVFEPNLIIVRSKAETPNQEELYESWYL